MAMRGLINKILEAFLSLLMGLLVIDVLWQVASRYLLSSPSSVTDEIAGFLLVWVGLLGAAYCYGKGEHLAIDYLRQYVSPEVDRYISFAINGVVILFATFVMVVGGSWLVYSRFYLSVTSASLSLNLGYVYSILPISGVITIYYAVNNILELLKLKVLKIN